jgi:imidazolonepropionase
MKADLVLTGARLVTCEPASGDGPLGVVDHGALAALEGGIVWAGRQEDLRREVEPQTGVLELDAGGRVVLPGLVDCHTHLVFAGDRTAEFSARVWGEPYAAGGVQATVSATRAAPSPELERLALRRLDRFLAHGVTTVEAKSGYGLTLQDERRLLEVSAGLRHPVDVVRTFLGAHVVPPEFAGDPDGYVHLVCDRMIPSLGLLAEFCDVWCEEGAFTPAQARRVLRAARMAGLGVKVHAEQLGHSGGAAVAAEHAAVSADHLERATRGDAAALARSRTVGVLLPGASMMTGGVFAPARMLVEEGVRVALSTDFNPGTSLSENLQLVVALGCVHLHLTPAEAILGVTRHAAAALAREGRIGSLRPGAACDLLLLDASSEVDLAYHYGVNLTRAVVKAGVLVHGAV